MRRISVVLLPVCLLIALPVAAARAADPTPLPSDATIVVPGHGWGHGRGMGQYGAKGMAEAGKTYREIVAHFYSGVTLGARQTDEPIRVLVEQSSDVVVTSDAPFSVWRSTGSQIATSTDAYPFMRVKYSGEQYRYEKAASSSGPWSLITTSNAYGIFKRGTKMLQLVFAAGGVRYYRGTIIARYSSSRGMMSINDLTVQEYLYGVVPRESPASWHAEALKSQAVAARTYSLYKKDYSRSKGYAFDICATTSCQVYGGYAYKTCLTCTRQDLEYSSTNGAVDATGGQALLFNSKPILAEFSSSTGGYSAAGNVPYQKAVPDDGDEVSPHHEWRATMTAAEVEKKWPVIGRLVGARVTERNGYGEWGGRVSTLQLIGTESTISVSGGGWRSAFQWPTRSSGVRSTWFNLLYWNGELVDAPAALSVPAGDAARIPVQVRNTGNTSWKIGGPIRVGTYAASQFRTDAWISDTRAASVARNVTDPADQVVRPGDVAEFSVPISTAGVTPGTYAQQFRVIADGYSTMTPSFTVNVQVLSSWTPEAPDLLTNGSFENGATGWSRSGTAAVITGNARDGDRSYRLGSGDAAVTQRVALAGGAARRFVLGGWARADDTTPGGGAVELRGTLHYSDGTSTTTRIPFEEAPHAWEYAERALTPAAGKRLSGVTTTMFFSNSAGSAAFDGVRLLESPIANPSFESGTTSWGTSGLAAGDGSQTAAARDGVRALTLSGASATKRVNQSIPLSGRASERFAFSAWSKATAPSASGGDTSLALTFRNTDGTTTTTTIAVPKVAHDWTYREVTARADKAFSSAAVAISVSNQAGSFSFDAVRVTRTWVDNGSFESGLRSWTPFGFGDADGPIATVTREGGQGLRLTGGARRGVVQQVTVRGSKGARFVASAWNRNNATTPDRGTIGLIVGFRNADGTTSWVSVPFDRAPHGWVFTERALSAPKPFSRVDVYAVSYNQTGSAYFDGIRFRSA